MPNSEAELCKKIQEMEEAWQFPCCWSAVDGCHIPLKCPAGGLEASKEYHNFKNFYSVILMAMVDSNYQFIWGSCGFPGNHTTIRYSNAMLTPKQRCFNYRLSRARMVTEGAYGQLKGRWRVLHRKYESSAKEVKIITLACVILHNICISQNDQLPKYWDITSDLHISAEVRDTLDMTKAQKVKDSEKEAIKIRNALADHFLQEKVEAEKI